jgi:glycosyltransferase involved in cell wall biosynthesis
VEVAVPVYNEAGELAARLRQLRTELDAVIGTWASPVRIVVADNGSTDGTGTLARALMDELSPMRVLDVPVRGKGAAVIAAWQSSTADIVAYTDLDQSAPDSQLPRLLARLEHADLVVGDRYMAGGVAVRTWRRRLARVVPSVMRARSGLSFLFGATARGCECLPTPTVHSHRTTDSR